MLTHATASAARTILLAAAASMIGLAAALFALEFILRLLPVTQPLERQPVNVSSPYLHYKPNSDVTYSKGWNFAIVNRVRVNNLGFVNDQDYEPGATSPLLAIVGDSYVEAVEVPYRETVHGRLAALVGTRGRVYSFATSGSPLSQYLAYARYARDRFRPAALAVVIVGNDFDESFYEYRPYPGYHYLKDGNYGSYDLELVPFEPSRWYRLLRRSALAQYVYNSIPLVITRLRALTAGEKTAFVGNVAAEADAERIEKSRQAIGYFLEALPASSGLPPENIILLIDGMRTELYDPAQLEKAEASYFAEMRRHLLAGARDRRYHVVDLQPRFVARHIRDGARFEFAIDHHWNSTGHEEAAFAILDTGVPQRLFGLLSREGAN